MKNKQIIEYLKKPGNVVALVGAWGTGKSYLWNNTIKPELEATGKKVFMVSLFGKTSIADVKKEMLNLAISAAGWTKPILGFLATVFLTVVLFVFLSQIDFLDNCITNFKDMVFIISLLISLFVVCRYFSYILKFVGQKVIGFDHNNIDFAQICNASKTVLCFDDFERMNYEGSVRELLGFVQHLSENKFSVMLILNDQEFEAEIDVWNKFKEKVIKKQYSHNCAGVLDLILREEKTSSTIRNFVVCIHKQLNNLKRDSYSHEALILIDRFANNFRFYKKITSELQGIECETRGFSSLKSTTVRGILYYVLYMVVKQEMGELGHKPITKDDLFDFYYRKDLVNIENKETKKGFGNVFSSDFNIELAVYPNIHKWFVGERFDRGLFLQNDIILPSKTERFSDRIGHWMDYSRLEQKNIVAQFEELFQKDKKPFRTFARMRDVLDKYVIFCSYIKKNLTEKNSVELLKKIKNFIKDNKIELTLLEHGTSDLILHREHSADEDFVDNIRFINRSFGKLLIEYWESEIKKKPDIISEIEANSRESAYTKMCLYLFLEDKKGWDKLFKLRNVDYLRWTNALRSIKRSMDYYDDGYGIIRSLDELRRDNAALKFEFIRSLKSHLRQVLKDPKTGLSERNFVRNLFPEAV